MLAWVILCCMHNGDVTYILMFAKHSNGDGAAWTLPFSDSFVQILNSETGYTGRTFACSPPQLGQRARSSANICIRPFYPLPINHQR